MLFLQPTSSSSLKGFYTNTIVFMRKSGIVSTKVQYL